MQGILMSVESFVQTTLSKELGKTKSDMSNIIFGEIDAIISARVVKILRKKYGVIISETPFFITIFRPVDVNSEEWRSQVADDVYFNIWEKGDFLREYILDNLTNLCRKTKEDFEFINIELGIFQKRVIPEDQKQCKYIRYSLNRWCVWLTGKTSNVVHVEPLIHKQQHLRAPSNK